ncbi:MAG TPA: MFS transporter, partial [Planctomycetota bacterium]|nr:MFS transporter [Planctomycetota bacterium]
FTREARLFLAGSACMGASFTVPFTLLAIYLDLLGLDKAAVGAVVSGAPWGQLLAALPAAWFIARLPAQRVLTGSAILSGIGYAVLPWMGSVAGLLAVNVLCGFVWSVHYIAGAPFLYRHGTAEQRPLLFSLYEALRTLASVGGALGAGWAAAWLSAELGDDVRGHALALSLSGVLPVSACIFYGRIADRPLPGRRQAPFFARIVEHRGLIARFAGPQLLIAVGSGMTIPFMSLYFTERFDFTTDGVGVLFAGGQVLMSLGFLATPWILARLGYVRGVTATQFASVPFFLVLAFAASPGVAVVAFLLRTALMNSAHPLMKGFLMETAPEDLREVQNAVLMLLWGLGWVVGPVVGGALLDHVGGEYAWVMGCTVALYLVGTSATYASL